LSSVLPISLLVLTLSLFFVPVKLSTMSLFLLGAVLLIQGMALFTLGADMAMLPMGKVLPAISCWRTNAFASSIPESIYPFSLPLRTSGDNASKNASRRL